MTVGPTYSDNDQDQDQVAPQCKEDKDCGTGKVCAGGLCRTQCEKDEDCPKGMRCNLAAHACVRSADGDADGINPEDDLDQEEIPADVELPSELSDDDGHTEVPTDGDAPTEAELPTDGDANPEAEHPADGDTTEPEQAQDCTVTGCAEGYICNTETKQCEAKPDDCSTKGCPEGWVCQPDGTCQIDRAKWPNQCNPCFTGDQCGGADCMYNNESQESFCADKCSDGKCPEGANCVYYDWDWVCQPTASCGNAHNIGGACDADADCVSGTSCIKEDDNMFGVNWPRGYCTLVGCTDDASCANPYTRCSTVSYGETKVRMCLHLCDLTVRCREGYECTQVSGQPVYVCVPR